MDIRQIDPSDEAAARRHWEIGKAAEDSSRPYDFYPTWQSTWRGLSQPRADLDVVLLGAYVDEVMWGTAQVDHPLCDNLHSAYAAYYVHPDRQRQGIGRTLAEASYDVARRRGRRLLRTEAFAPVEDTSAGLLFADAIGFTTGLVDGIKVVDLVDTEHLWDALAVASAGKHTDYRLVTWTDHLPEELVDDYCRLNEMFVGEAPSGELEVEDETWDEERIRAREDRNRRRGRRDVAAGALAPDGTLVALTEASVFDDAPTKGHQSGTLVDPEHRGHGLGTAIKVLNHRQLRDRFSRCRLLVTGNAAVNGPMNAVNDALGYQMVERCIEMQRGI